MLRFRSDFKEGTETGPYSLVIDVNIREKIKALSLQISSVQFATVIFRSVSTSVICG